MKSVLAKTALCVGLLGVCLLRAAAEEQAPSSAEAQFQRAFYLSVHEHDQAGAAAAYEKVVGDPSAPESLQSEARARLAELREDMALASFAQLMPSDVMAYAEVIDPGEHVERVLKMLGLVRSAAAASQPAEPPIALGGGLVLPADFAISPALIGELKKLRGLAVGVTAINDRGIPAGLAIVHPGDCDLLRGAIETAVQLLPPGEPIEGYPTYRIPDIGWLMLTARLVLVSDSRQQLTAAVERLRNPQAESLATRAEFKRVRSEIEKPCIFAYVDGQQVVKRFGSQLKGQEAAIVRGLLDLDHFESAAVALSTTDNAIQLRAEMNLMPGHRNMLYALVRTAPITRRSLAQVPKGAVGVVVIGLNPPTTAPQPADGAQRPDPPSVSAMDIGREFFHNIEELAVFALPPTAESAGLPEVAAVIAVKDVEKSAALWNQLLTLAALFGAHSAQPPTDVTIEGQAGKSYQFDRIPPIVVVRAPDRGLLIGTHGAVTASLRASANNESIETDEAFAGLLAHLTPDTSKAVLVDVGRALEWAAAISGGSDAREARAAAQLARDMKVSLVTDESPNQLLIRAEVSGLPKFRGVLRWILRNDSRGSTAGNR